MKRWLLALALGAVAAAPLAAQQVEVRDCAGRMSPLGIVEPWEDYSRTYSNGKVRVALMDLLEPAGGPVYLMLLSPPYNEIGDRQCKTIGVDGIGFWNADFPTLDASYDPATGLRFTMAVELYDPQSGGGRAALLTATLNQATGAIDARLSR
ncbi:hypothetical protein [Sulfitobacter alexandrii]|uniref:hypothetical protein n=1 Tax=Sulfitobacter alexandrii TaxID=1917485 RepID=UPI0009F904CD|nr:hypothetical protein [Sulfitobacter alexandrii]